MNKKNKSEISLYLPEIASQIFLENNQIKADNYSMSRSEERRVGKEC